MTSPATNPVAINLPSFPFMRGVSTTLGEPRIDGAADPSLFDRVSRRLRADLGDSVFDSWFGRLELDGVIGGVAHFSVPTRFLKSWIKTHYIERMIAIVVAESPSVRAVSIGIRTASRAATVDPSRIVGEPPGMPLIGQPRVAGIKDGVAPLAYPAVSFAAGLGSPLDRRMTFESFLTGDSNQLAQVAAYRVATVPSDHTFPFNPLYIHGPVGFGKTHLLHAVAHEATALKSRVIYLTAENFKYSFVAALRTDTSMSFRERLRDVDMLVLDDVQFLQGKSIQREFEHVINAMIGAGKRIVVAADCPPNELEGLEERLRSRLAGGLCVEMGAPDHVLRVKILEAKVTAAQRVNPAFDVPHDVITYVASVIQTNGRDLEGAINRLIAYASLTQAPLCVETAGVAIRNLARDRAPKRVKIEDIQKLVATHYGVDRNDILSARRTAKVVRPRQIAMYLAKVITLRSLPEIGRRFGGRDHTTALHAVRKIETLRVTDRSLDEELTGLRAMLEGRA